MTQAAATAKWGGYTLSDYLDRLINHPLESSISRLEGDDYPDTIGIALFMAYEQVLDQLRKEHPQQETIAIPLLDSLSLLAASGVPTHWLLTLNNDSDAVRDTLSTLKRSSIFQESADGGKTIIHRLQGQVYRETYLSSQEKFSEALTYTTTVLNKVKIESLDNFEDQRQEVRDLVEQIGAVTPQSHSHPLFSDPTFVSILATTLHHAADLGMPQLALTLTDSVTQADDALGPDHPSTQASRNNLAGAYQDAGRLDDAITLYEQTLDDRTRTLGPRHPDTLLSRNNLATAYQTAGRLDEAITLHEQTLKDLENLLGPHHPHTLTARNNLALDYQTTGRLDEAITLHEQTLKDLENLLGPHHPHTLTARNNLALDYQTTGRLDEAIPLFEQNLTNLTHVLGPHHPHTLTARNNLAIAYQNASRLDEAIPLFEQTLEDRTRILGRRHPDALLSRDNLAGTYRAAGRFEDAEKLFETPSDSEDEQDGTEDNLDQEAGN